MKSEDHMEATKDALDSVIASRNALDDTCKAFQPTENDEFILALAEVVEHTARYLVRLQEALDHLYQRRSSGVRQPARVQDYEA